DGALEGLRHDGQTDDVADHGDPRRGTDAAGAGHAHGRRLVEAQAGDRPLLRELVVDARDRWVVHRPVALVADVVGRRVGEGAAGLVDDGAADDDLAAVPRPDHDGYDGG